MKHIVKPLALVLAIALFTTCEKFEVQPATKVETGKAIPLATSLTVNAQIIDLSGEGNTDHGFCYATHSEPTIEDGKASLGNPKVGDFTSDIVGLTLNTHYYVRAYCQSAEGIVYGKAVSINTLDGQSALTTTEVTNVTATSAFTGGNITSDGGAAVTARGVVWSTSPNPVLEGENSTDDLKSDSLKTKKELIAASKKNVSQSITGLHENNINTGGYTSDGSDTGSFTSNLTNLQPGTVYYVRAYATNEVGTAYGNQFEFETRDGSPALTTNTLTNITATAATCGGNITDNGGDSISSRGVCWGTSQNPTIADNKTEDGRGIGEFTSELTGLSLNTTYYVRAYATNNVGTVYGNEQNFITQEGLPSGLSTAAIAEITTNTATAGGNVTDDGGVSITAKGVCWSTSSSPTLADNKTEDGAGTGEFTSNITGLSLNTTYYVRAYATNSNGTAYGNEETFTTLDGIPIITTNDISEITATSATCGGNITDNGGLEISARGVCWSTSESPTIADNKTEDGSGTGSFTSNLTILSANTTYYVRAYATNSQGTAYGNELSFTTEKALPVLTTAEIINITGTSANSGGNITDNGGFTITARGVCWSTSSNPTTTDNKTEDGTGSGTFSSNITGLASNTTYYVRAYATSSQGTGYGDELTFTTASLPELTTNEIGIITSSSAICGGSISGDGGSAITHRGVCWSTANNPTVDDSKTVNGSGTGSFSSELTGLTKNTTYYVRAYATTSMGTAYGDEKTFTTLDNQQAYSPETGKIWMDRNLGASQVATSDDDANAYGDLYQWGRAADGHEKRTSATTTTLSTTDFPGHGKFIITDTDPYDWRSPQNNDLWQGVNGTNNPCPSGYRLPTVPEWEAERTTWSSNSTWGAFSSALKLTSAGKRLDDNGNLNGVSSQGEYWSSTVDGNKVQRLWFYSTGASISALNRAHGFSVRCIKDDAEATLPTVATLGVSEILDVTATCGGNVIADAGYTVTARGACWSTSPNPTTANNTTSDGSGNGEFTSNLSGLTANTTYYVRAYATNSSGTAYGNEVSFTTIDPQFTGETGTLTDHDGNTYNWVGIGTQVWMAENLKVTHYPDGTAIPLVTDGTIWANLGDNNTDDAYCYYNNNANGEADTYGALYTYAAALDACPSGWHLPTDEEWTTLENYLSNNGHNGTEGSALKANSGWDYNNGTDDYGFSALPGGSRYCTESGQFGNAGTQGYWWSSTEDNSHPNTNSYHRLMQYSDVNRYSNPRSFGYSVRCLRD